MFRWNYTAHDDSESLIDKIHYTRSKMHTSLLSQILVLRSNAQTFTSARTNDECMHVGNARQHCNKYVSSARGEFLSCIINSL